MVLTGRANRRGRRFGLAANLTGYPTDQKSAPNRSSIVKGAGGKSRYYLFEQLLDQRGTRNGDAKLMGKLQTDLEILEKDRRRGSQGQLRPMISDTALSA